MILPSLGDIVAAAQRAARRFPFVLVAGVVSAVAGMVLISGPKDDAPLVRLLASATLGLPLGFGLAVVAERRARTRVTYWLIAASGIVVLFGFWYAWASWTETMRAIRYTQLLIAAHLFVAIAPFIGYREPNAFWQYNRILFLRFLTAAVYAAVLWMGLSAALLAINKLLGVGVEGEAYGRLWMVFAFVFHSWFFVAGIPEDFSALESRRDYPRGLRVFTQYVLVTLVVIYLVILTLYFAKVVVTREWPSGWIGYLVSGVAGVGMLSWLLVRPLEDQSEHAWVKGFTRGFYIALMPAIVMLWLAIWKRVAQYGITERRYFLIVLSLWLAGIAVYYTFSRSRNIKVIPATLCVLAVLGLAGPWSAYAVSRANQTNRLASVLERNRLLAGGALRPSTRPVSALDAKAINAGLLYLIETHGRRSVDRWIPDSLRTRIDSTADGRSERAAAATRAIMAVIGVKPASGWDAPGSFRFGARRTTKVMNIADYTHVVELSGAELRDSVTVTGNVVVRGSADSTTLLVTRGGVTVLTIPLLPVLDRLKSFVGVRSYQVPERMMTVEARSGTTAALLRLTSISGPRANRVASMAGDLYLRLP